MEAAGGTQERCRGKKGVRYRAGEPPDPSSATAFPAVVMREVSRHTPILRFYTQKIWEENVNFPYIKSGYGWVLLYSGSPYI